MDILGIGGFVKKIGVLLQAKKIYGNLMKHIHDPNREVEVVMPDKAVVEVKPAIKSKINIAAIITAAVAVAGVVGLKIPDELPQHIEAWITLGIAIYTIIMRTWFTTKLTPSSAARINPDTTNVNNVPANDK